MTERMMYPPAILVNEYVEIKSSFSVFQKTKPRVATSFLLTEDVLLGRVFENMTLSRLRTTYLLLT